MKRPRHRLKFRFIRTAGKWVIVFLLLTSLAHAQSREEPFPGRDESGSPSPEQSNGSPTLTLPVNYDWIQLTSGEWLGGDIKTLYNNELQFDSVKLGLLELDLGDIRQIQGNRRHSVRFKGDSYENGVTVTGILTVAGDTVTVDTGDGILVFDRNRLFSIAAREGQFARSLSARLSFSMGIRKGNSKQIDFNSTASLEHFTSRKRFRFEYIGIFNKTDGTEVANSQRIASHYDIFHTTRFFWRPVFVEYFQDPISNIQNRFSIGSGLGYRFIYTPRTTLDITAGIAYQNTQNVSSEVGQASRSSTPALVLVSEYEVELTDDIDFNTTYPLDIVNQDSGEYWHHAVVGIEIGLTPRLGFDLSLIWDRIKNPKKTESGLTPARDDYHVIFGIGYRY